DPDVLFVSELDSPETIEASVELALNGSKVLSTYSSFDSMGALLRLKSQGLETFLISSSNITLLSQRLVRKLCDACKQQDFPHPDLLNLLGLREVANDSDQKVWGSRGCSECNQTGYVGQTVLHEIMVLNESMREALLEPQPAAKKIRGLARNEAKLVSMAEDGYCKAVVGITSLAEVQRVAYINEYDSHTSRPAAELLASCKGENKDWL
ncbi:MAG TPA: ATPase, T2SS/T4P/T4SS family, partial [Candidatus Obscuribacterales bacterium]